MHFYCTLINDIPHSTVDNKEPLIQAGLPFLLSGLCVVFSDGLLLKMKVYIDFIFEKYIP